MPQGIDKGSRSTPEYKSYKQPYFPLAENTLENLFLLFIDVHGRPKDSLLLSKENAIQFLKNTRKTDYEEFVLPW